MGSRARVTLALVFILGACSSGPGGSSTTPPPAADTTPPTVPGDVTATASSATRVVISWTASSDSGTGVAGYRLYRDGSSSALATVTATNYTDTPVNASTTYAYTVRAFDGATPPNQSALSDSASVTTPAAPPPGSTGLDERPSNTSCLAGDAPSSVISLGVERVFATLGTFDQPIAMLQAPGNNTRWYVLQKSGSIRVFNNTPNVASSSEFFSLAGSMNSSPTTISDERGLLGMAFHPDWPTNPRAYIFYTATHSTLGLVDRIAEFRSTDGGATLSASTELVILDVDDPETNHNGGQLSFGPDGMLYAGIGDGGGADDAHGDRGNGQLLTTLLGKMLRIDVSAASQATPYTIPASNPFASNPRCTGGRGDQSCPEIYAYGFRNPWRWNFDRVSGDLWLNDVGQSDLEEIDKVVLGGNYGWRCFEGTDPFNAACGSNPNPLPPVAQYSHARGFSTTGGYVYRGSAIPALAGRYVFGDYGGALWSIPTNTAPTLNLGAGLSTGLQIVSFGQDQNGELYIVNLGNRTNAGSLYRLVQGSGAGRQIPAQLSATGCVSASDATQPASGLIAYAPNAPFFSDGAQKARWMAVPNGQLVTVNDENDFEFPNGSVLVKNFSLGTRLVETRLFMRHNDGNWAGYTYEWNPAGTDATRVVGGKIVQVEGQTWEFPSESQCLQCHTAAAGRTLGLEIGQLNGDLQYHTGRTANQLATLDAIDLLTPPLTQPPAQLPVIPDPFGSAALDSRARAYLHTNCANCHQPSGGTPSSLDLRFTTALADTAACDVAPNLGSLGITNARLIAPGSAARSVVVARVNRTGADAMPPLSRHQIDTAGVQLLTDWIDGLAACN